MPFSSDQDGASRGLPKRIGAAARYVACAESARYGTSLRAHTAPLTYRQLVGLLGPPNAPVDDEGKISSAWVLEDALFPGRVFTLYDYRAGNDLWAPEGMELKRFRRRAHSWHVGAHDGTPVTEFLYWLADEARAYATFVAWLERELARHADHPRIAAGDPRPSTTFVATWLKRCARALVYAVRTRVERARARLRRGRQLRWGRILAVLAVSVALGALVAGLIRGENSSGAAAAPSKAADADALLVPDDVLCLLRAGDPSGRVEALLGEPTLRSDSADHLNLTYITESETEKVTFVFEGDQLRHVFHSLTSSDGRSQFRPIPTCLALPAPPPQFSGPWRVGG